jgi:crossover junction endodeoxyribonuclease RusA
MASAGTFYFTLPFPPAKLSPNARLHWRALDRVKKSYKTDCAWSLFQSPVPDLNEGERIPLTITINPPDKRRRDRDNTQSSLKYAMDQLAEHLGVDDYLFDPSYRFGDPVNGGCVTVAIGEDV